MSGPTYPRVTGVYGFDIFDTVISQYANSTRLTSLIQSLFDCLNPAADFDLFYNNVWNIDTANGEGLDVLGRILGIGRVIPITTILPYFSFDEAHHTGFGFGPFYSGETSTQNYPLSDDAYRLLLLAKAASNITDGSIKAINQILLLLFPGRGNAYVQELHDNSLYLTFGEVLPSPGFGPVPFYNGEQLLVMHIAYVFNFELLPYEISIVQQSGVLPKPTGVKAEIVIDPTSVFVPVGDDSFTTSDGYTLLVHDT